MVLTIKPGKFDHDLTTTSLENHPDMASILLSDILQFTQNQIHSHLESGTMENPNNKWMTIDAYRIVDDDIC